MPLETSSGRSNNKVEMTREELEAQIKQLLRSGHMRLVPESQVIDAEAKRLGQGDD